jgi:hypothetical protein
MPKPRGSAIAIVSPLAGAMTGPIKVHMPTGDLTTPQTYKVLPSISDFTPKSGPVGTVITITGMSLKQTTSVTIGRAVTASFTVVSDTQVTVPVPPGAVTGKVSLKTKGGTAIARKLLRDPPYEQARGKIAGQLGEILARIHAVHLKSLPPLVHREAADHVAEDRGGVRPRETAAIGKIRGALGLQ